MDLICLNCKKIFSNSSNLKKHKNKNISCNAPKKNKE